MGLFPEIPAFPEIPEIPENSPKKAMPFKLKSVVRFAWINCLETAGTTETAETTERIFDTLFRCRLFRLCGLCGLKKNLPKRETQFLVRRAPSATLGEKGDDG